VWEHLLPAMKLVVALPTDDAAAKKLADRLKGLKVRPVEGTASAAPKGLGRKVHVRRQRPELESLASRARATTAP
jgi:hypothetical protein